MKENVIKKKSFDFALMIIDTYNFLQAKREYVLSKQLLRSGTSIGAMICESEHAESKLDFVHKIAIAQKEANESLYWIELLFQSKTIDETMYKSIKDKLDELQKIIASIIISCKANLNDSKK